MVQQIRSRVLVVFVAATILFYLSGAVASHSFEMIVHTVADKSPEDVTIQGDHDPQPTSLGRDASKSSTFRGTLDWPPNADEKSKFQQIREPYMLVGRWGNSSEQLYLGFGLGLPKKLEIEIFHEEVSEAPRTLETIELLGKDYRSQLKCYFLSRAYHRKWRTQLKQPCHQAALRSAKLWFDSAAGLALRKNTIFLMDGEIVEIMKEYEELAKTDRNFSERYRRYVPSRYVGGTVEQTIAAPFSVVGTIPTLVETRQLDEAMELNAHVKAVLTNETLSTKQIIEKHQKVNIDLLEKNENYIGSLKEKQLR
ncbi:MAG: hypothetical protein A2031_05935 [Deltaproteobacteria bacterium RBG_19FT_COMBO_43_11]|nr:MAG: hypothetical protein A2W27_07045 [Deltaproteobacteria bacterium RBG_16_44_11]OGP91122.1 MAG: hypothetical protein A2031_05935 [Deltaproteobacteria bacterium RBG_19FT_COMBO_43_11]